MHLNELSTLIGLENMDAVKVEQAAKEIIKKYPCEVVVVSLGKSGAMVVTKNEIFKVKAPDVLVKSTVGAEDSMVAGIVLSLTQGLNFEQALKYGVACGTAAMMKPGTELCNKEDADKIYTTL